MQFQDSLENIFLKTAITESFESSNSLLNLGKLIFLIKKN